METHRLCQVLPCCWGAQHKIAGLLASLFCCLSFGKTIARYKTDHLFDSRKRKEKKNRPRSISGCFMSISVCLFLMQLLICQCDLLLLFFLDFCSIIDDHQQMCVCVGLQELIRRPSWLELLDRASSTRNSPVFPVTLLEKEQGVFMVVSCTGQRSSVSVSCEICRSYLPGIAAYFLQLWGREKAGTAVALVFPLQASSEGVDRKQARSHCFCCFLKPIIRFVQTTF